MHADPHPSTHISRSVKSPGQLAACAQMAAMAGVWLAIMPVMSLYAGGVWAARAVRRRLTQHA